MVRLDLENRVSDIAIVEKLGTRTGEFDQNVRLRLAASLSCARRIVADQRVEGALSDVEPTRFGTPTEFVFVRLKGA